jgi:modulator of FtsH protease HflK
MKQHGKMEMAWNEPGDSGDDPWGNKKTSKKPGASGGGNKPQGPDIDEMIGKVREKFSGGGSGLFSLILVIALLAWLAWGFYIVDESERGVVFRFGQYSETTEPGLNWHIPYPVEHVEVVNIKRIREEEIGYRASSRRAGSIQSESVMLTKDENYVDVEFSVQYQLISAKDYLINVKDPDTTLFEVAQSAMRDIVGKNKMDFILTEGRENIVDSAKELIQKTLDNYNTGIQVLSVNMRDAQPPDQVQNAFADAVKAREDKQRFINNAEAYRNSILPVARGRASRIVAEANGYREQIVAKAQGDTARFNQILQQYRKAPAVTRKRMYLETMEKVFGDNAKVIMDTKNNALFMLPLEKMMQQQAGNNPAPQANSAPVANPPAVSRAPVVRQRAPVPPSQYQIIREGR